MKTLILILTITLGLSSISQGQLSQQNFTSANFHHIDALSQYSVPTPSLAMYKNSDSPGIPPALLIVLGVAGVVGGALIATQAPYVGTLLLTGGIGLATTGIVLVVYNKKNGDFTGISLVHKF